MTKNNTNDFNEKNNFTETTVGIWRDVYKDRDGNIVGVSSGKINAPSFKKNLIVSDISKIIAALFKGDATYGKEIKYWAVGRSNIAPTTTDTQLVDEVFRKPILPSDISYLDDNGNVVAGPTNRLEIKTTFDFADANVDTNAGESLQEFAIVAGNATTTLNTGLILDRVSHNPVYKNDQLAIERTIRFRF